MKKILLITALFCITIISNINAQCTADPTYVNAGVPGMFPTPAEGVADGEKDSVYAQVFTIIVPSDTTIIPSDYVPGAPTTPVNVTVNSSTVTAITGLPGALTYACANSCTYPGGTTNGCFIIEGFPFSAGTDSFYVSVVLNVELPVFGATDAPAQDIGYLLTINGCALTVTATVTNETTPGADDGTATAIVANGTPPYTYLWGDGQTTSTATGLAPGTAYYIQVTDAASCTDTVNVTILAAGVGINTINTYTFEVYPVMPNPSTDNAEIRFTSPDYRDVNLTVHNMIGALVVSKRMYSEKGMNVVSLNADKLRPGVYFVTLTDGENTSTKRMVVGSN